MLPVRWISARRFNRLERLMDRVVREPVEPFRFLPTLWDRRAHSALDVYETEENVVVKTTLPGIKVGDVDVTVTGDTLVIKGDTHRRRGGTSCSGNATADFQDGVLTVTLPKAERVRTRKVEVTIKETVKAGM
jgi:HSP20 family protein